MNKPLSLLPILAGLALVGCVTTERMPDGKTRIRFSDDTANSLASLMPTGAVSALSASATGGNGELNLIATKNPLRNADELYFNGQYGFECAAGLLYSAKSGQPLDADISETCRHSYVHRQTQLKLEGRPHDRRATEYDPSKPLKAYWAEVTGRTISQLSMIQQFPTSIGKMGTIGRDGTITITMGFHGNYGEPRSTLTTTPVRIPVVIDDAAFEQSIRNEAARLESDSVGFLACDAVLAYDKAIDRGPRHGGDHSPRYVVNFTVPSIHCRNPSKYRSTASR